MERLQKQWGYVMEHEYTAKGNPLFTHMHTADPAALVEKTRCGSSRALTSPDSTAPTS